METVIGRAVILIADPNESSGIAALGRRFLAESVRATAAGSCFLAESVRDRGHRESCFFWGGAESVRVRVSGIAALGSRFLAESVRDRSPRESVFG